MAKDNKEGRKSTRSFDLNKSKKRSFELDKKWRTRQTLWGGRTDANPKLSLNDT